MPRTVADQCADTFAAARGTVSAAAEPDRLAAFLSGNGILCGSGCVGAHEQLLALGERLQAPIVHATRGEERVEWDNAIMSS
jgi:pyruvate dehydrogenase (quinone)